MRRPAFFVAVVLMVTCGPTPNAQLPGYDPPKGGSVSPSTGGTTGTGGTVGTGGVVETGGTTVSPATGGRDGSGGAVAAGGRSVTGGSVSSGGARATGGVVGSGGLTAAGGARSSGGAMAIDAGSIPSTVDGGNCISKVINNGYACGTAPPCSACKDNDTSLEDKCKTVLTCFESKYPCSGNCETECLNSAGASGPVRTCVAALQSAACGAGGGC